MHLLERLEVGQKVYMKAGPYVNEGVVFKIWTKHSTIEVLTKSNGHNLFDKDGNGREDEPADPAVGPWTLLTEEEYKTRIRERFPQETVQ
jgi:hypothetical protein